MRLVQALAEQLGGKLLLLANPEKLITLRFAIA